MVNNSFRLIQQLKLFLAHPNPPGNVWIYENVCVKTYLTSEKRFIDFCIYKEYLC